MGKYFFKTDPSSFCFQITTCHPHHHQEAYDAHFWAPPSETAFASDIVSSSDGYKMDVMSGGMARDGVVVVAAKAAAAAVGASQDGEEERGRRPHRPQMSTNHVHLISFLFGCRKQIIELAGDMR